MSENIQSKIDSLVKNNPVLLFMKGNREHPQCGFSRQVVEVLEQLLPDFQTVDVLSDPAIREGIKSYSSWPTLPQLYINGEFIGGCDIVRDLYKTEELQNKLEVKKAATAPQIAISEKARSSFIKASAEEPNEQIRIKIYANFKHSLEFDEQSASDFALNQGGFTLIIDPYSAERAEGLSIDFVEEGLEPGFSFKNPNEPPAVKELEVKELAAWHEEGKELLLLDVRPKDEWLTAHIDFAKRLEDLSAETIRGLDKNALIIFHCHFGGRSSRAAKAWRNRGFTNLYNLSGGIDAWSKEVDKTVPLY